MQELYVVCAVLWDEAGRLLLARRAPGQQLAGSWELPGGKVEAGETAAAAVEREIAEELGWQIQALTALGTNHFSTGPRRIRLEAWLCQYRGGALALTVHDAIAWVAPADWVNYNIAPGDWPLLRQLGDRPRP